MTKLYRLFLVFAVCALPALAYGDVPAYQVNKERSFLKFIAIQNSAPVEGRFETYTAEIRFDPDHLEQSSIRVEVETGSLKLANEDVLKTLVTPEWLSVEMFPKATFVSKKILRMPSTDNYYAEGELTLRGKSMPVALNFRMEHLDASGAIATGYASLSRKDFGIGQGEWASDDVVKHAVRVEFRITASRQPQ